MVHIMFVDGLSRPSHSKPVAGRGIAMRTAGHANSDVRCSYCRGVGNRLPDCTILKAKERRCGPDRCPTSTQSTGASPLKGERQKSGGGGDGKHQWCSFHKSTTHSDAGCRLQHYNKTEGGSAKCDTHSCYPTVLSARDQPPGCNPKRQCIPFTAVEVPTEEKGFWHSASEDEPTDSSGLFEAFGRVTTEKADSTALVVEEGPIRGLGFRGRITGGLASVMLSRNGG